MERRRWDYFLYISMQPVEPAATKMFVWSAADASAEARETRGPWSYCGGDLLYNGQYPAAALGVRVGAQMRQLGEVVVS